MNIYTCMTSHVPSIALKSLPLITKLDGVSLLVHKDQTDDFNKALDESPYDTPSSLHLVTHDVGLKNGVFLYGDLRKIQQEITQSDMSEGDLGLMLDHDINLTGSCYIDPLRLNLYHDLRHERKKFIEERSYLKLVASQHGGRRKYLEKNGLYDELEEYNRLWPIYSDKLTSRSLAARVEGVGLYTLENDEKFFTFNHSSSPKCAKARKGGFWMKGSWAGVLGVTHDAPNLWNCDTTVCEDTEFQARLFSEYGRPCIVEDPNTALQMTIIKEKYKEGGIYYEERMRNLKTIYGEHPNGMKIANNFRCGLNHGRIG